MRETLVQSLGQEDPLEKGKATYSSIQAWRIPWTVYSKGSQRVGHDWATFMQTISVNPYFLTYIKVNSKWIIGQNMKTENIKLKQQS